MTRWTLLASCAVLVFCAVAIAPRAVAEEAESETYAVPAEETRTCPECGYENKADVNFCIKCGARLQGEAPAGKVYCPNCGALNREDSKFCSKCGQTLRGDKAGGGKAAAGPGSGAGVYFIAGLASYGDAELDFLGQYTVEVGSSMAIGAGLGLPLLNRGRFSLGLSTDIGSNKMSEESDDGLIGLGSEMSYIPIRETALISIGLGPRNMVRPFGGFGGGIALIKWKFEYVPGAVTLDEGSCVHPVYDIPFGCEFRLARHFGIGVRADYLIVPGEVEMAWEVGPYQIDALTTIPDVFLVGGTARIYF